MDVETLLVPGEILSQSAVAEDSFMKSVYIAVVFFSLCAFSSIVFASESNTGGYAHQKLPRHISKWLDNSSAFRLANESDCACATDLEEIRNKSQGQWKAEPRYLPYRVLGDFDGNGKYEIALLLVKTAENGVLSASVAIFPKEQKNVVVPIVVNLPFGPQGVGLFFGAPRKKPYRLLVGPFGSEGLIFVPNGNGYVLETGSK